VRLKEAFWLVPFIVFFLAGAPIFAQDETPQDANDQAASPSDQASSPPSVDQLFEAPQGDTETTAGDAAVLLTAFHAQSLTVSGSLTAKAGGVVGFKDGQSSTGAYDGSYVFDMTPGLSIVPSLTFTSRPDETVRIQGTVAFPYSPSSSFSVAIQEMFFDYTLLNRVYFRIGMHTVCWGVSRLFAAGGDLMASSGTGLDIKANMPIGSGGITAVTLLPSSDISWRAMTYGLQGDLPFGKSELILSSTYFDKAAATPLLATAAFKTSLFGIDLFAEGVGSWARDPAPALSGIVSGFYWERVDPEFKVYGEYYYNAAGASWKDQRVALVAGADNVFGSPFTVALEWIHAFIDNSGYIIPGVSFDLWPHVSMQVGIPFRYGAPGSYYLVNQPPSIATASDAGDVLSWSQRYGIMFRLTLSTGF